MTKRRSHANSALNGLSIDTLSVSQDGDLEVEFDLPHDQTTSRWHTQLRASRSFDIYEDDELKEACRRLFQLVRERVMQPDDDRAQVNCDDCATSDCCRKYNVLLRAEDITRLAKGLNVSTAELVDHYTADAVDWCGDFARQLESDEDDSGDEKCVFLQRDELGRWRCSVYEHRPQICRDFDMKSCDDFVAIEDIGVLRS